MSVESRRGAASNRDEVLSAKLEALAAQTILIGLCRALEQIDQKHVSAIEMAFDFADQIAEISALRYGDAESGIYLSEFARIVEELRSAAIPSQREAGCES